MARLGRTAEGRQVGEVGGPRSGTPTGAGSSVMPHSSWEALTTTHPDPVPAVPLARGAERTFAGTASSLVSGRSADAATGVPFVDVAVVEEVDGPALAELGRRWSVVRDPEAWRDAARLSAAARSARALVVRNRAQVTRALLEAAPGLEVVARAGVGLDNVDVAAADEFGVVVVAAAGANAASVAEHAIALALALARDIVGHDMRARQGRWERAAGRELTGRTWGVIGLGATGRATARLAGVLGMSLVGYDPFMADGDTGPEGVELVPLDELLGRSHVVSLHLAASAESRRMVDQTFLRAMRPDAVLVNVARGELVDEVALLGALDEGVIAGAGLDVRVVEPPGPDELSRHARVVSTPHVAGITGAAQLRVVAMIADDVDRALSDREVLHPAGRLRRPGSGRSVGT